MKNYTSQKYSSQRATPNAERFENRLWPNQLQALVDGLTATEDLIGMCRCSIPGEVGRYVALLLTTERLAWNRETPMSGTAYGSASWSDISSITDRGNKGSTTDGFDVNVVAGSWTCRGTRIDDRRGP
jgi:hypothetical protein